MASIIESINKIRVYEEQSIPIAADQSSKPTITIREHMSDRELVIIIKDKRSITVSVKELIAAVYNAQNAHG